MPPSIIINNNTNNNNNNNQTMQTVQTVQPLMINNNSNNNSNNNNDRTQSIQQPMNNNNTNPSIQTPMNIANNNNVMNHNINNLSTTLTIPPPPFSNIPPMQFQPTSLPDTMTINQSSLLLPQPPPIYVNNNNNNNIYNDNLNNNNISYQSSISEQQKHHHQKRRSSKKRKRRKKKIKQPTKNANGETRKPYMNGLENAVQIGADKNKIFVLAVKLWAKDKHNIDLNIYRKKGDEKCGRENCDACSPTEDKLDPSVNENLWRKHFDCPSKVAHFGVFQRVFFNYNCDIRGHYKKNCHKKDYKEIELSLFTFPHIMYLF